MDIDDQLYSGAELCETFGLTPRALRFYESRGLLQPRRVGNRRIYTYRDKARLVLILRGKRLGFSLAEIGEYLELYDYDETQVEQLKLLRQRVAERRADLNLQQRALTEALTELDEIDQQINTALATKD